MPNPSSLPRSPQVDTGVQRGIKVATITVALISAIVLLCFTSQVLLILFAALFLAIFFSGLARALQKWIPLSYSLCLALALLALAALLLLAFLLVGPAVAEQTANLTQTLPKAYDLVLNQLKSSQWGASLISSVGQALEAAKDGTLQNTWRFAGLTLHGVAGLLFSLVLGIFLASQPELYRQGLLSLFPKNRRHRVEEALNELGFTLWWWLMGQLASMASVGILIGTGLTILGVPLSGTLGLIAAILSFIPSVGPLIAVLPAILLGLTISPAMGLWVGLLYLAVQTLESNLITPLVQLRTISLPPALILASELFLGLLLGGVGLAFATPLAAAALVLVNMFYVQDLLGEPGFLPSTSHQKPKVLQRPP